MEQFTSNEVRELAKHMESVGWRPDSKGDPECYDEGAARSAEILFAFADLLEAQEKAVPVATCGHSSTVEHRASNANVVGSNPIARSNSDAERLAEALRNARGFVLHFGDEPARVCIAEIDAALAAHSAQAQSPVASVPDTLAVFEVVSGVEGPCLTISRKADGKPRHEYRLAGQKPWGGGNTTHSFKVHTRELREQIDAIEAALAAQEKPNG